MNPSTTGARVLLDELVRLGVHEIVLCPGSRSAPLAYAAHDLDAAGRARLHVRVDERGAAFLALGLAKESGHPAAVITTSGTAVANLHPAVLEAHHGAVPLLLLTADRPPELRRVGANQATDQRGLFGEHLRLALELETPGDPERQAPGWRTAAARAHAAATGALTSRGLAGPVHLDLPYRDPLEPGTADDGPPLPASVSGRPGGAPWVSLPDRPDAFALEGAAVMSIEHDSDTLVVIGELPSAAHRTAALDWARRQGAPVIAEPGPGSHELVLPHGAQILAAAGWVEANLPRRVLVIGRPTLGRGIPALTRHPGVRVEVVTPGEPGAAGWADATHEAAAVHPFAALADTERREVTPFARTWLEAGERVAEGLARVDDGLDGPAVARVVHDALPYGAALFLGSSSVARDVHLGVARPRPEVAPLTSRGLAGIDGCVSTAVGIALARGSRPTVALLGDLTFLHDANGLLIGPDEPHPDLTIVVVDDDGGSIFGTLEYGAEELAGPMRRIFTTPTGTDIETLCASHGIPATSARSAEELGELIGRPSAGIRVIRVPLDGSARRSAGQRTRDAVVAALVD